MKTVMHQAFSNVEMIHNYLCERFQRYESLLGREGQWLNRLSANPQKWSNDQFDHFVGLTLKGFKALAQNSKAPVVLVKNGLDRGA